MQVQLSPVSAPSLRRTLRGSPCLSLVVSSIILAALLEALLLQFLRSFHTSAILNCASIIATEADAPLGTFLRLSEWRISGQLSDTASYHFLIGGGIQISNIHRIYIGDFQIRFLPSQLGWWKLRIPG